MMNEEDYIRNKMGNSPFRVPEGYFEHLAPKIMSKLPEQPVKQKPVLVKRLRPLLYAAACICVAVFSVAIYFNHKDVGQPLASTLQQQDTYYNDTYIDEVADYAMLDNEEIYYSLLADI